MLKKQLIDTVQILDFAGKDKFQAQLAVVRNTERFRDVVALGIVRDAEQNKATRAFESVCYALKQNNLPVPAALATVMPGKPKTSIFIMPDNNESGMLENLCLQTLAEQPIASCIEQFMQCYSGGMVQQQKERLNSPKAQVQVYLATRIPIVNSLGLAAQKDYWDFEHSAFHAIKQFLHDLFAS